MNLTPENQIWLQNCSKSLQTNPETLLNGLLNTLKSTLGPTPQNLHEWFQKNEELKKNIAQELKNLEETRIIVEEASRAAILYLTQLKYPNKNS
jgi:hypothetical protein